MELKSFCWNYLQVLVFVFYLFDNRFLRLQQRSDWDLCIYKAHFDRQGLYQPNELDLKINRKKRKHWSISCCCLIYLNLIENGYQLFVHFEMKLSRLLLNLLTKQEKCSQKWIRANIKVLSSRIFRIVKLYVTSSNIFFLYELDSIRCFIVNWHSTRLLFFNLLFLDHFHLRINNIREKLEQFYRKYKYMLVLSYSMHEKVELMDRCESILKMKKTHRFFFF